MQYPLTIFNDWRPTNEPAYYKTRTGDEYCIISLGKTYKSGNDTIRDTIRVQAFGPDSSYIHYMQQKHNGLKGVPLDIYAEMVPYSKNGEITHNFKIVKVSVSNTYFYEEKANAVKPEQEQTPKQETQDDVLNFMDSL